MGIRVPNINLKSVQFLIIFIENTIKISNNIIKDINNLVLFINKFSKKNNKNL